jgi:hypothetical protein
MSATLKGLRKRRNDSNIELGAMEGPSFKLLPRGYAWWAAWIAEDKDNEADVYRVFRRLTARTLLYRQSELMVLEAKLADLDELDANKQRGAAPGDVQDIDDVTAIWPVEDDHQSDTHAEREHLMAMIDGKLREYRVYHYLYLPLCNLTNPGRRITRPSKQGLQS